jgi:sulfotransferase
MTKRIHYITGMPRAGSTLLCNVLCQNHEFYASGTSPVSVLMRNVMATYSSAPATRNQIDAEKEMYFERFKRVAHGVLQNWYSVKDESVIFDKCRGWMVNYTALKAITESPKMVIMVRDLRDIVASAVKGSDDTSLFVDELPLTLDGKVTALLEPSGVVGGPLMGLADLHQRGVFNNPGEVFVLKYEEFCSNPTEVMEALYKFIDEPQFKHQYENIVKAHHEDDSAWCYTFPHDGTGKVLPPATDKWRHVLPECIASSIWSRHKWFFEAFGYKE